MSQEVVVHDFWGSKRRLLLWHKQQCRSPKHLSTRCLFNWGLNTIPWDCQFSGYVSCLFHMLLEDTYDKWVLFCKIAMIQCWDYPQVLQKILWTEGVIVKLSGHISNHTSVCTGACRFHILQWKHSGINLEYALRAVLPCLAQAANNTWRVLLGVSHISKY
jgi:hypothetical protein